MIHRPYLVPGNRPHTRPAHLFAALLAAGLLCAPTALARQVRVITTSGGGIVVEEGDGPPEEMAMPPQPMPAGVVMPGVPGAAPAGPTTLSKDEITELRTLYDSLAFEDQQSMKAYYADMGVMLADVFGLTAQEAAAAARTQELVMAMQQMDFTRRPQAVLAARSKLGYGQVAQPNAATAQAREVALWIQLNALAGEWGVLGDLFRSRPETEARAVYGLMLQNLGKADPGMLPEEVLLVADACPGMPQEQHLASLSQLVRLASAKHSTHVLMQKINAGTRVFGKQDAVQRRGTVDFLAGAGLVVEAYDFLPSLEDARAAADPELILVHARYKENLAGKEVPGPEQDKFREQAWDLYCEVSRLTKAPLPKVKEALTRNIGMMALLPRVKVTPWLEEAFANPTIGPVALEILTLKADTIGDLQLPEEKRAEAIVLMKECVDVMLAHNTMEGSSLRIPLGMLTRTLAAELEGVTAKKNQPNQPYWMRMQPTYDSQVMLRAVPDKRWLDAIEPSLATRVTKAGMAVALHGSELDLAMNLLRDGVKRTPTQASDLADHFLISWASELTPRDDSEMYPYWFWYNNRTTAPVTRGKQTRRLERLHEMFVALEGSGVNPRTLPSIVQVFQNCHAGTEIYTRDDIERVFGPINKMPPSTCVVLAGTMGRNLSGDWRNREAQQKKGVKRSDTEIARLVDKGYGIAIDLMDSAIAGGDGGNGGDGSWRYNAIKAGLTFDRMQYRNIRKQLKAEEQNEYRKAAFLAFEQAALRYAQAVSKGEEREYVDVYTQWFGAALGTPTLNFLRLDDMPSESAQQDDQIDHIRRAIEALPRDAAFRHVANFAQVVSAAVGRADPEVKPRLVKHALRIIGDHPAGASLRAQDELYRDLMKDEIKLRLTIDGEDNVGVNKPFGVLISLRYTNAVERETGGFAKYLQNGVYSQVGNTWREVNFRDRFQKQLEESLTKNFTIETLSFFDAFMPPNNVRENGEDGWLEKPMAYVILERKDATIDRLPQIVLDMQFSDDTGPVTLAMPSNTPALAITGDTPARPYEELVVTQIVDVRDAIHGDKDKAVKLEVTLKGKGVLPSVRDVLDGLESAVPGYKVSENGIESQPAVILQTGAQPSGSRFFFSQQNQAPAEGYPVPDEDGMYRLPTEKTWTVTFKPEGGPSSATFHLPTLKKGIQAKLDSKQYADFDIVPVTGTTVSVSIPWHWWNWALLVAALLGVTAFAVWLARRIAGRRPVAAEAAFALPVKLTPLTTILALQRWQSQHESRLDPAAREELVREIKEVERRYFGPEADTEVNGELAVVLERWSKKVGHR